MILGTFSRNDLGRLLSAACVVLGLAACTKKDPLANRAVLNVDGRELTASVFADQLALKLRHLDALTAKDPGVLQRTKDDLIRDFIISVLSENWAKGNDIFVRAEDLEKEISRIRSSYPDDNAFEKVLAEQGLTFKDWKESLRRTLLQKLVAERLNQKVSPPSEEELKNYYQNNKETFERPEQVQLRQIVLAKEADAKLIEEQLKKGKALADLAENHSITPEGKRAKGVVGWIEKGVLDGFDTAFSMRPGQRSPIFKSPYGYHIFEVIGKRPAQTVPFEQVKGRIKNILLANRGQAVFTAWLEGELRKARVLKDQELISKIRIETKGD
ncbi:MAG: peptidyl-prolyl cis-trans isomerase [Bdellovibrionales bacterium]